jgi:hypothetical protein
MGRQLLADGCLTLVNLAMIIIGAYILIAIDQYMRVSKKEVTFQSTTVEANTSMALSDRLATQQAH